MSSYRSYTPWKTSLGSTYKSGASSTYSSRDDVGTTRYSSLVSPSTYRPSFAGGTYRIKRDPPPVTSSTYVSRYGSAAASSTKSERDNSSEASAKSSQIKRYGGAATSTLAKPYSREPSPAAIERTNQRLKSREPSPGRVSYDSGVSSYRLSTPKATGSMYRYSGASTSRTTSISYLSASDVRTPARKEKSAEKETSDETNQGEKVTKVASNVTVAVEQETETQSELIEEEKEEERFIAVSVVTRATSPTPPGSTTVHRTRRFDIAKTIEKTLQRSTRKRQTLEKEIQSDRLDDSTRYSRFSSRLSSSYSPHSDSRYTSSNMRYSASPLSTTSKSSSVEPARREESQSSSTKSDRYNALKSKLSPPKVVRLNGRQTSTESLSSNKPPAAPKSESPTKSCSSGSTNAKLPNKDFRKSALNVGPTDRPRKSRTPSSGTESDGLQQNIQTGALVNGTNGKQQHDRSPSAGSEISNHSSLANAKRNGTESKLRQRCHAVKTSATDAVVTSTSQQNGYAHKSCTPATSISTTPMGSSSSSGAESSASEHKKSGKKSTKKKALQQKQLQSNIQNKSMGDRDSRVTLTTAAEKIASANDMGSAGDSNAMSPKRSAENSTSAQAKQPPATLTDSGGCSATPESTTIPESSAPAISSGVGAVNDSGSRAGSREKAHGRRLQKLSSVSNFFAARQNDTNSEPIFLESSESTSGGDSDAKGSSSVSISLTADFETNTTQTTTAAAAATTITATTNFAGTANTSDTATASETNSVELSRTYDDPTNTRNNNGTKKSSSSNTQSAKSSNSSAESSAGVDEEITRQSSSVPNTTSITHGSSTEQEEDSSWWQDTSRQIDTASALDYNHKDEMRLKLRHIDSGETAAWWLRNDDDEDDTLADDDLKTLNQAGEDEASEATDGASSLPIHSNSDGQSVKQNWWVSDENGEDDPVAHNGNDHNGINYDDRNGPVDNEVVIQLARSHLTPERQDWWEESTEEKTPSRQNGLKIKHSDSGQCAWWLNDDENDGNNIAVEATISLPAKGKSKDRSSSSSKATPQSEPANGHRWWMAEPTKKLFGAVKRVDSGEKAWWQDEVASRDAESKTLPTQPKRQVERSESGQQGAWWLVDEEENTEQPLNNRHCIDANDVELQMVNRYAITPPRYGNLANSQTELSNSFNFEYAERPPPLGQCASPVDLEETVTRPHPRHPQAQPPTPPVRHCKSPYDIIPMPKAQASEQQAHQYQQKQQQQQQYSNYNGYIASETRSKQPPPPPRRGEKLFISRHQNIDELLGGSCRPLSPLFMHDGLNSSHNADNNVKYDTPPPAGRNLFLEEITPDKVRIHDSTAQMPVIQRLQQENNFGAGTLEQHQPLYGVLEPSREWQHYAAAPATPSQLPATAAMPRYDHRKIDDAAIQVYKDGDYGAYLDLESSLAEQAEEIEGLNSSRKNSLVVRTQLTVRVHAIIEKLLSAEGSDLRRALFSLKQVFQEDKDLVHAFVALGGLNCLVRVGNGADQNYQNYILRALGQVMLYVDGMNGVMKHQPTMQWLYSLIASNYRSVVKTALKLLLVFVEYAETNCYVLVNAIHAVDKLQGQPPWSNIMRLLKDYDNADAELVIYATSLINKTLAGLNDQDSFYDESDLLEQQGMESVIQRYMAKPGTDLDLLDQLQLYEAVLKFEDGESENLLHADSSVRKTLRHRPGTDTAERRKSRRHSSTSSPLVGGNNTKTLPVVKRMGVMPDEDSSGSANSTELSGGIFQEKKSRDGAGVTPGLRRRRERADRQKSFLKEQQEAAANGILAAMERREEMGQIVTAIPVTLKNGDSPPESLMLPQHDDTISANQNNASQYQNPPTAVHSYNQFTANATNNNNNNNNNNSHASCNNSSNHNNLSSPTKQFIANNGNNANLIITNSFDKMHHNNNNTANNNNKGSQEFLSKKNLLMECNATVINGIMKNIHRSSSAGGSSSEEHINNNNNNNSTAYRKYENDANRLNSYYSQLGSPKTTTPPSPTQTSSSLLAAMLSPRRLPNAFDFTHPSSTPLMPHTLLETNSGGDAAYSPESPLSPLTPSQPRSLEYPESPVESGVCMSNATTIRPVPPPPAPPPPPPPPDLLMGFAMQRPISGTSPAPGTLGKHEAKRSAESDNEDKKLLQQLKRDHTVKDLTQKLNSLPTSPVQEAKLQTCIVGDMTGLISKAKEGLAKSKSKGEMSRSSSVDQDIKKAEPKKSENELHWEELVRSMARPLNLCDLDFTDLNSDDEKDLLAPRGLGVGVPPPPPPFGGKPPPMMMIMMPGMNYSGPPSLTNSVNSSMNGSINGDMTLTKKNKKTVKLFWKEVREDMIPIVVGKTIWDELPAANVDTQKLEHLFESRAKDLMTKKQQELNKSKEVIVLDHKRSNAINIAMTKLPPPRAIKVAILKMDATVVTREGIDKLLNMLPTDEERGKIQEAQMANPELPLGSAEQFLLTLASISELGARLKLWAFRLDFDNSEKEIAEPLMDLKQGIEILRHNRTFRCILSTLLSVGIFLNGARVKGFQIEYLAKVPEVKDTVHKHSLLHHLCHMVMETNADTTDLYSEIGPITRASKADFADLALNLTQLETECKASWDRLKLIAKHDCPPQLKQKLVDFLADCAERIIILQIVHRRVVNRYRKFLLWLGVPQHSVVESKPNEFSRIVSEFALEYRTTRERVQQQLEKKANHRERNKTRGKMIIDIAKFKTKEDRADAELKQLLGTPTDNVDGTATWRRRRMEQLRSPTTRQSEENLTDPDDEILESLVKTATKAPGTRTTPRERKRTRNADRKSLRRTLKNGLTEEEKQHVAAMVNTY